MKKLLMILCTAFAAISCSGDYHAKQIVRDYLKGIGITDYKEIEWGKVDSIFSPHDAKMSYEVLESLVNADIADLELKELQDEKNAQLYRDTISQLKDSISNARMNLFRIVTADNPVKNRKGIKLHLSYKDRLGTTHDRNIIFVFNKDGQSIGHHIDADDIMSNY